MFWEKNTLYMHTHKMITKTKNKNYENKAEIILNDRKINSLDVLK